MKKILFIHKMIAAVVVVGALLMPRVAMAQVSVKATIDSMTLFVGQQAHIRLDVNCPKGTHVLFPQLKDTLTAGVELVQTSAIDTAQRDEKLQKLSRIYTITSFDSAIYAIPPFQVEANGNVYATNQLAFKVLSPEVDTLHTDRFFGPKTVMDAPFSWDDWKGVFGLSLLCVLLMLLNIYLFVRYKENKPIIHIAKRVKKLPSHVVAMQKIETIKTEKRWEGQDAKSYYTDLTDIIRNYISERYHFNASEMTSGEIIQRLLSETNEEELHELRELFSTADLVKFAKYYPQLNENDRNLLSAVDFINQTKNENEGLQEAETPTHEEVEAVRTRKQRNMVAVFIIMVLLLIIALLAFIAYRVYLNCL